MKILGRVCVFLILGFFLGAGVKGGYTSLSSEVLDSYLGEFESVSFKKEPLPHYEGLDRGRQFYIFQSRQLETSAFGFAGPIDLIIVTDSNKIIDKVIIEDSQETPQYLRRVKPWLEVFEGKPLAGFADSVISVDAVTQATHSSLAVVETVRASSVVILESFLNRTARKKFLEEPIRWQGVIALVLFCLFGIILFHKSRSKKKRYFFLLALALSIGFWFNLQFSFIHIINILNLNLELIFQALPGIIILIPLFFGFFYGRIYCGWFCPFGALQELMAVVGRPVKVSKKIEKKLKYIKYFFLGILIFLFFWRGGLNVFNQDPLGRAFDFSLLFAWDGFLAWLILFLSLFFIRFWCRYFCPVGAFLSFFNKIAFFKSVFKKRFSRCPWYVDKLRDSSCILCNRCQNH